MLRDLLWLTGIVGGAGWIFARAARRSGGCGGCPMSGGCRVRGGCAEEAPSVGPGPV